MDVDVPLSDVFQTSSSDVTNQTSNSAHAKIEPKSSPLTSPTPTEIPEKDVLSAVLQICRKYNLKVSIGREFVMIPLY